jgi:glycosyltransferase involved in cell wall biosynthesis
MQKKIAVIIPCLNEEKTVEKVIKDFKNVLPEARIFIFDNNSTDNSAKLARKAGATVKKVENRGKGNVVREMFKTVNADCYLMVDADDTYFAKSAKKMVNLILEKNYDMVIGDRISTSYFKENKRAFHSFGNRFVRFLIRIFYHQKINDIMTGYRAFSKKFAKTYPAKSKGFEVETEMTIFAINHKLKNKEIPIKYQSRKHGSKSKVKTIKDGIKIIFFILKSFIKKY